MQDKPYLILVIDDDAEIQRLVQQRFSRKFRNGELNFQFAENGMAAWERPWSVCIVRQRLGRLYTG